MGHLESKRGGEAVPDRTFLGARGPAPGLEGDLSAAGDHAAGLMRDAGGAEDFVEARLWGCKHLAFLRRFLPFVEGIPFHDTLNDVVNALDPALFKTCFVAWVG